MPTIFLVKLILYARCKVSVHTDSTGLLGGLTVAYAHNNGNLKGEVFANLIRRDHGGIGSHSMLYDIQ